MEFFDKHISGKDNSSTHNSQPSTINTKYTKQIIDYGFKDPLKNLFKMLILNFLMRVIIYYSISFINLDVVKLLLGFIIGSIFYISFAWVLNLGEIRTIHSFVNQK